MKEIIVSKADDGKRVDRWLKGACPSLPPGLIQKYIRLKRVKRNGKHAKADEHVSSGDTMNLFIEDEFFEAKEKKDKLLSSFRANVNVVYEDENILLADKRPGLIAHPDETEKVNTLLTHIRAYLYQKGEGSANGGFMPVIVNRIDRFTGGIVICAKNEEAMKILSQKIRLREIEKKYLCLIDGKMQPDRGTLEGYILKTPGKSRVQALSAFVPGAQKAKTLYRTIAQVGGRTLLECTLVTGRTHQIRAQLASAGHPLAGDAAYGAKPDKEHTYQALYSYKLTFRFETDSGILEYLNGQTFQVKNVPFAKGLY
ncbi:MAG: RluA family pseudouridine synthase [Clostridia bacterium]|nr:RluA family pseudouridine synthase [Clostridia bacterium]